MSYPGGKNGAGVYQKIINLMPPHTVYIEPFLGGGAIMRNKKMAWKSIGIDKDQGAINSFSGDFSVETQVGCGIEFLEGYDYKGGELIYCDPPYPHETRSKANLYSYEMDDLDHLRLLKAIKNLPCKVMISSYYTDLYAHELNGWSYIEFEAMTRGGLRTESLWFNFETPVALHDYDYLGEGFRERERIKRKKQRWVKKFQSLPLLEQQALLAAIGDAGINHR